MKNHFIFLALFFIFSACNSDDDFSPAGKSEPFYFPSHPDSTWETTSPASLEWNEDAIQPLMDYLDEKNTKSFMILVNGRIVLEEYFDGHTPDAFWYWNDASYPLISSITGIAKQEGMVDLNEPVTNYLYPGWTNAPIEKETLITSKHLLTMTSGIGEPNQITSPLNLNYFADAGTHWSYHTIYKYLMLTTAYDFEIYQYYFNNRIQNLIGMNGGFVDVILTVNHRSNTRSMARFGLLALNRGKWNNDQIINEAYFTESISSSQNFNPAYGYGWWLNGKDFYMLPGSQTVYEGMLVPNAPEDMYAAMGEQDQRLYVVPGQKMVIVRMGYSANPGSTARALSEFDNELWGYINAVVGN